MLRKAIVITVLLVVLGLGTAFADQIDSLGSISGPVPPTNVYVNPGGLGDVLIYGYYNVRGNEQYFTVTNTDTRYGARVRVRFREAATLVGDKLCNGSYEVLDFDICLSPGDMWSGMIATGPNGNAKLYSADTDTYVNTATDKYVIYPTEYPNGVDFKYGSANPVPAITADQTREGYFEIIAERPLSDETCGGLQQPECTCGNLVDMGGYDANNVLMGHTYIIDPASTAAYGYVATALADFGNGDITDDLASPRPNLRENSEIGTIVPVNYALTKNALYTVYDLEAGFSGKTGLIVTFPTKIYTHDEPYDSVTGKCLKDPDLDDIFDDPRVIITVWDDAEHSPESVCEFSPCTTGLDNKLPHEVNVIDLNAGNLLVTDVAQEIASPYEFGWIKIDLVDAITSSPNPTHVTSYQGQNSYGLPAIGYVIHNFNGSAETGMMPLQYSYSSSIGE